MILKQKIIFLLLLFICFGCSKSKNVLFLKIKRDKVEHNIGEFEIDINTKRKTLCKLVVLNDTGFDLQILKDYKKFNYYGIGYNVLFWNQITGKMEQSKVFLEGFGYKKYSGSEFNVSKCFGSNEKISFTSPNKMLFENFKSIEQQLLGAGSNQLLSLNDKSNMLYSILVDPGQFPKLPQVENENGKKIPNDKLWRIFIRPHVFWAYKENNKDVVKRIYISDISINFAD